MTIEEWKKDRYLHSVEYLGDGVYAGHDGYQIWLGTDRYGEIHEIALDSRTYNALIDYVNGKGWS